MHEKWYNDEYYKLLKSSNQRSAGWKYTVKGKRMYIQIHKSHEWRKILFTLSLAEFMSLIVFETQQEGAKSKSSDRNQGLLSFSCNSVGINWNSWPTQIDKVHLSDFWARIKPLRNRLRHTNESSGWDYEPCYAKKYILAFMAHSTKCLAV